MIAVDYKAEYDRIATKMREMEDKLDTMQSTIENLSNEYDILLRESACLQSKIEAYEFCIRSMKI